MARTDRDGMRDSEGRRFWPLALVAVLVAGGVAIGLVFVGGARGGDRRESAAGAAAMAAPAGGCRLSESPYGYPDDYLSRTLPSRKHPPLPASGWHKPTEPLRFDRIFHSVFHGYLVITYRSDLSKSARAKLREWVLAHGGQRVVGAPTATPRAPLLEFTEWGWQLRCEDAVPSMAELGQFAARRASVP
jgi:hypothetical protein